MRTILVLEELTKEERDRLGEFLESEAVALRTEVVLGIDGRYTRGRPRVMQLFETFPGANGSFGVKIALYPKLHCFTFDGPLTALNAGVVKPTPVVCFVDMASRLDALEEAIGSTMASNADSPAEIMEPCGSNSSLNVAVMDEIIATVKRTNTSLMENLGHMSESISRSEQAAARITELGAAHRQRTQSAVEGLEQIRLAAQGIETLNQGSEEALGQVVTMIEQLQSELGKQP